MASRHHGVGVMHLTKHFTLAEATRSDTAVKLGLSNAPSPDDLQTLVETAHQMERVRTLLGDQPIHVNSWYRNEQVNRAVGGVPNSAHRLGYAVDFTCPNYGDVTAVCRAIEASGIQFDQLIWEYGRWVHVSFAPAMRQNVLHINKGTGYRPGLPE